MKQKKMIGKLLLLKTLLICSFSTFSNSKNDTTVVANDTFHIDYKGYGKSYLLDIKSIVLLPTEKTRARDLIALGAISATTAILFTQDDAIHTFFVDNVTRETEFVSQYLLEPIGSGKIPLPITAGMFIYGNFAKKTRPCTAAMNALKSYIITSALIQIPKYTLQRQRPFVEPNDSFSWFNGLDGTRYRSFPSGHTTAAFAFATSFALEYNDKKWVAPICYSFATLAGLSRIHDNKHWASDVFLGAVLGHTITKFIHRKNNWNLHYSYNPLINSPYVVASKSF